jgi:hypothetical protein
MADDILETFAGLKLPTQAQLDGLRRQGVVPRAMIYNWADEPVALRRGYVEWLPNGRFAFESESTSGVVHDCLVVVANDETGDPLDLIAFDLRGRFGSWLGLPVLGLENATAPRMSEGLSVFPNPVQWLASFRKGVVILDPNRARHFLESAGPFVVGSTDEGRHLMAAMTFKPQILIQSARVAA